LQAGGHIPLDYFPVLIVTPDKDLVIYFLTLVRSVYMHAFCAGFHEVYYFSLNIFNFTSPPTASEPTCPYQDAGAIVQSILICAGCWVAVVLESITVRTPPFVVVFVKASARGRVTILLKVTPTRWG